MVASFSGLFSQPVYGNSCSADINSTPSDANVYVEGRNVGKTPYFYFIGSPATFNLTIVKDSYQKWSRIINVPLEAHIQVQVDLVPLPNFTPTVTKTVTTIVTTISPTTIISTFTATSTATSIATSTATTTATTTIAVTSIVTQSAITSTKTTTLTSMLGGTSTTTVVSTQPAQTNTIISSVTEQTGFPSEVTYATAGIAVIAIIAAAFLGMRKK